MKCPPGGGGHFAEGISLLFQDKSPCEVSADRCPLFPCVHLTYYSSAQHSGYHLCGSADNALSLEPLSDTLGRTVRGDGVTLKPQRLYAKVPPVLLAFPVGSAR